MVVGRGGGGVGGGGGGLFDEGLEGRVVEGGGEAGGLAARGRRVLTYKTHIEINIDRWNER